MELLWTLAAPIIAITLVLLSIIVTNLMFVIFAELVSTLVSLWIKKNSNNVK